jgi:ABC-type Fe3+ transport system permease subunit
LGGWVIVFFYCVNEVTAAAFLGGLNSSVVGQITVDYYANGRLSEVAVISLIVTASTALVVLLTRRSLADAQRV